MADPKFQGQWWILGLAITSMLFNYILGEELLFRGVLCRDVRGLRPLGLGCQHRALRPLPRAQDMGLAERDASSFGYAWATKRYRSFWMGVIVHGVEGYFIVLVVAILAGWYP